MAKHVLITGTTGMVGKGVLLECLDSPEVTAITLVNRSPIDIQHPKIKEIILKDFMDMDSIKPQLTGIDACFHCMGVSAVNVTEEQYKQLTYQVTQRLADVCFDVNPNMIFNYVSGTGTDTTEKSRQMWARVKGKTENYILNKGFGNAYMFRPGIIIPERGTKSSVNWYNAIYVVLKPFFPLLKKLNSITTTTRIGSSMILTLNDPQLSTPYLYNADINALARLAE